jgi:GINS complex subunit 3
MCLLRYVFLIDYLGFSSKAHISSQTFKKRAADIADHAHNHRGALGEGADFLRGLDETERQLFRAGHDSAKAVRDWATNLNKTT